MLGFYNRTNRLIAHCLKHALATFEVRTDSKVFLLKAVVKYSQNLLFSRIETAATTVVNDDDHFAYSSTVNLKTQTQHNGPTARGFPNLHIRTTTEVLINLNRKSADLGTL